LLVFDLKTPDKAVMIVATSAIKRESPIWYERIFRSDSDVEFFWKTSALQTAGDMVTRFEKLQQGQVYFLKRGAHGGVTSQNVKDWIEAEAYEKKRFDSLVRYLETEGYTEFYQMPRIVKGISAEGNRAVEQLWDNAVYCKNYDGKRFLFFVESNHDMALAFLKTTECRLRILGELLATTRTLQYYKLPYSEFRNQGCCYWSQFS
jgi:hypothetical protein